MAREFVNEASACTVSARFFGLGNIAIVPASVRYRIRDLTNDRVVTDWTDIAPAASLDIQVSAQENAVYRDRRPFKRYEQRVVSVQSDYGTANQMSADIPYLIRNLQGFDS